MQAPAKRVRALVLTAGLALLTPVRAASVPQRTGQPFVPLNGNPWYRGDGYEGLLDDSVVPPTRSAACSIDGCLRCDVDSNQCLQCNPPLRYWNNECVRQCPYPALPYFVSTTSGNRCGIPKKTRCRRAEGCDCGGPGCRQCLFPKPPIQDIVEDSALKLVGLEGLFDASQCTKCDDGLFLENGGCYDTRLCYRDFKETASGKIKVRFFDDRGKRCSCGDSNCEVCETVLLKEDDGSYAGQRIQRRCLGCAKNLHVNSDFTKRVSPWECVPAAQCFPGKFPRKDVVGNRYCARSPGVKRQQLPAICDMTQEQPVLEHPDGFGPLNGTGGGTVPCVCADEQRCKLCQFSFNGTTREASQTCLECVGRWLQSGKCTDGCLPGFAHVLGDGGVKFCSPKAVVCSDGLTEDGAFCKCPRNCRTCSYGLNNSKGKDMAKCLECYPGYRQSRHHCKRGKKKG